MSIAIAHCTALCAPPQVPVVQQSPTDAEIWVQRASEFFDADVTMVEDGSTWDEKLPMCYAEQEWMWTQMREDAAYYAQAPRNYPEPCPWCGVRLIDHTNACKELRKSWAPEMPWGKHKGQRLDTIPTDYLTHTLKRFTAISGELRQAIEHELSTRY